MPSRAQLEAWLTDPRVRAFLDVIARAEGTDPHGRGVGYDVIVNPGGRLTDYSRHPKKRVAVKTKTGVIYSTAAGRYQYLYSTWTRVANKYGLRDFSPHSQDLGAVALLHERGALPRLLANDFEGAVYAARKEWASFPGAGYGQGERKLSTLRNWYGSAGVSGVARVTQPAGSPAVQVAPVLARSAGAVVVGILASR